MLMVVFLDRRFDSRTSINMRETLEGKVPTKMSAFANISSSANHATKKSYGCQPRKGEDKLERGHKHAYEQ